MLGTAVALAMTQARSALDAWWMMAGVLSGGSLGLFLLGLISRRTSNRGAIAGVTAGVLVILWMTVSPKWTFWPEALRSPFHGFLTIVFGTAAILLIGFLVTAFTRRETPSRS
jgi:SSS family solute:Na+ symporter